MERELSGKTVVVTGASSGIGLAGAVELSRRGATVVAVGRTPAKLEAAATRIHAAAPTGTSVADPIQADFACMDDVRAVADTVLERHPSVHVLVNNAGLLMRERELTADGFETTFAVNHLAPFLLTRLLRDRLVSSAPSRVITTSSAGHKTGRLRFDDLTLKQDWKPFRAYGQSKLANILFTSELANRLDGTGVTANCFHPGSVRTDFGTHLWLIRFGQRLTRPFSFTSPEHGAAQMLMLATKPAGATTSGRYWSRGRPTSPSRRARDPEAAARLWTESERLVGTC